jgi:hypothetical protein
VSRLPPNHNITLFTKGITTLSRVSGHEHKKICCILLGLVVDLLLPEGRSPVRLVQAIWALLDFLYLAQYPSHSADTLSHLDNALSRFHDNKQIFVELGARKNFNFPKLHSLLHYASSIKRFGTAVDYNTEQSERLHIDFAKRDEPQGRVSSNDTVVRASRENPVSHGTNSIAARL